MKPSLILAALLGCLLAGTGVSAQSSNIDDTMMYVFADFVPGDVLMKSGATENAPLNYNAYNQTVLFKKDGQLFTLVGLEAIDTIYLSGKKYVPVEGKVYEVIEGKKAVALYATYTYKRSRLKGSNDHNGYDKEDQARVNNAVTDSYVGRRFKSNYAVDIHKEFWLQKKGKFYQAGSEKQIVKLFPDSTADDIKAYIKEHKINFDDEQDMKALVVFCNNKSGS